ncbi:IS3 family transposase [Microcoleus sp. ARI1-A3]|uniref:IS3 family transposase n=1 Tax=Microcoleus sp. ARI1-A3 TaxID=2818558 RepID=UPI003FA5D7A9
MSNSAKKPSPNRSTTTSERKPAQSIIKDIQRQTRRQYTAEEKIRIVLEGLQGEQSVAEICRREGLNTNIYYRWSKEFLEAGKKRLAGDTTREATAPEVQSIKSENEALKQLVAELSLENRLLKKNLRATTNRYHRMTQSEKMEIITLVEQSPLSVKATLRELGINRSTFYEWYKRYLTDGYDGLADPTYCRTSAWNQLPLAEKGRVVELALERPDLSCRELACYIVDNEGWFVSESTVYRILKSRGLVTTPAYRLMEAADQFYNPTTAPNQLWQTDFTYFKIKNWGWYYLSTVLDDYARYILAWELCPGMQATDVERTVQSALQASSLSVGQRPRMLSDNGSAYVSRYLKEYLKGESIDHIRSAPFHPMTQGKIERYHRSMKNVLLLEHYYSPDELRQRLAEWVEYYNHQRYHESLDNVRPADAYWGRQDQILADRQKTKQLTMVQRRKNHIFQRLQSA